ncbi:peptidoglycan DD-metalloendopeptidase family protein [Staphylococcus kloosii]|uniref:peptidoglycan DD-metalloendopeptidase family protein n=1 Tax=Staphylococcus kloosii TaxID=29384 RepID=UPI00189D0599|nr:peptidoglycan DD-metalloendopeptidase family protein [Staphylococcus kloosii]MBF7028936.1 peptidoglycan DD-metalloendopeptidase family protein [Staphylococcus kloosii]
MAEDIRSMRIEMSMKDMGIERTVANIKKSFNTLKSEVNSSNKEFTYGEKSIDSYKKHISQLEQAQEASEKNLKEMTREYHKVGDAQGYASNEALGLQKSISEQEKELGFLKRELDSANKGLEQFKKNQAIDNSSFTKIGKSFQNIGNDITSISQKMGEVGTSLTNKITKPAVIAGGAIGAMVGKLGFDRLVGLDTAQAKLKGLGYSTEEVGRISDQVTSAVEGGMTTLGEGVDVAAGALAAGVDEGKDLEKYIKLVGDAAVGSNRPVNEMATIFNRVQGQGKLMTEELNSIEDGMPGFSNAMAEHLNVSYEAFRDMVSNGEVKTEDFLTVMDDFAGGMAESYAESWQGMLANTKSYIGQIGESLLSGVFEQSKNSLKEFEDLMRSEAVQKWAEETGTKLANAFTTIGNGIKNVMNWWKGLDSSTQQTLGSLAKYAGITLVAVGPLLKTFSMLGKAVGGIFGPFGKFLGFLGKIGPEAKVAGSLLGGITNIAPKLGLALGVLTGPIGWIVGGIAALATGFTIAYKKSETFRNIVNGAIEAVKNAFTVFWDVVKPVLAGLWDIIKTVFQQINDAGKEIIEMLSEQFGPAFNEVGDAVKALQPVFEAVMNGIKAVVDFVMPGVKAVFKNTFDAIKGIVTGAVDVILGIVKVFTGLFTGNFKLMWSGIKQIFSGFISVIVGIFKGSFVGQIISFAKGMWQNVKQIFTNLWNDAKSIFSNLSAVVVAIWTVMKDKVINFAKGIWNGVKAAFNALKNSVTAIFNAVKTFVVKVWTSLKNNVINLAKLLWAGVKTNFNNLKGGITAIFNAVKNFAIKVWTTIKNSVVKLAKSLWNGVKNTFNTLKKGVSTIFNAVKNFVVKLWTSIKNKVINLAKALWQGVRDKFNALKKSVNKIISDLRNYVVNKWKNLKQSVVNLATGAKDGVVKGFKAMYDKGVEWLNKLKSFIKKAKDGFKKVATSLGKGVANGAISGLNAMIDGINSLSKKIMKKKLIKKSIPKLSTGTDANPGVKTDSQGRLTKGTKAIVNDKGIGNGKGPNGHKELIYRRSGKIEQPRGNNKKVTLKRGDGVINGARSQSLMPHLSKGTIKDELFGAISGGANKVKDTASKGFHKAKDTGTSLIEGGKDLAGKAKKAFDKAIGDVMEYVKNPMKLVDKTMKFFGVDFSNVTGEAMSGTMDFGYKGLKNSVKDLIAGWFDELEGGDGDSGWLLKHDILQTFGNYTGGLMFNGGKHYGVDFGMPTGTSIKALTDGTVTQAGAVSGGGGNQVTIKEPGGKWYQWYMHMMNGGVKAKKGQKVKAGDEIGKSGSTGNSTTPHLHIQRMKGYPSNETAVDPMKWLKSLKGGGKKSASKWKSDIRKAAKEMGVSVSKSDVNGIASLINAESGGDPKITQQIQDINSGGNEAQGLLQYVPSTFKAYAKKGHTNIKSGYDQLLAFFNNKNWKSDYNPNGGWGPTGARKFATGGIIRTDGLYNLAEDGHEEVMMSMDPKRATDTMKLMGYVQEKLRGKDNNKRPNQVPNRYGKTSSNSKNRELELMAQQIKRQDETIDVLKQMLSAVLDIQQQPKGFGERDVSQAQGRKARMKAYARGGAIV